MKNNNNSSLKGTIMTKTEALAYIVDEMQTVLDDDMPDKEDDLWCNLCDDHGFSEAEADEVIGVWRKM
jgi:hypothetical protein